MSKEQVLKIIETKIGKGWFKADDETIKELLKEANSSIVVELRGLDEVKIETLDDLKKRMEIWGFE